MDSGSNLTARREETMMAKPDELNETDHNDGDKKDRESVTVVVNGAATVVAIRGNPTLAEVVTQALAQTQNSGQPVENWELRGPDGAPLTDLQVKVKKLDFDKSDQLFLNLRAGIGG
jgi:Protein of Unknown function (DUF2604)